MPTVPKLTQPQTQPRGFSGRGFSSSARPVDTGSQAIAQGLSDVGQAAGQIAERERDRQTSVEVMRAERQLNEYDVERLYGEDGALRKQGRDAIGLPDQVMSDYQSKVEEIESSLGTPEARRTFRELANRRLTDAKRTVLRHERAEIEAYGEAETKAFIQTSQNAAAANYNNPDRIRTEIERQKNVIRAQAVRNGLPAAVVDQRIQEATSQTHSQALNRMLANDEYYRARSYLEQNRDEMAGEQLTSAEKAVEEGTLRADAQANADNIVATNSERSEALKEAREIDDPQVRDETLNRVNQQFDEMEAIERQRQKEAMAEASRRVEWTGSTDEIPPDQWMALSASQRSSLEQRARQVRSGVEPTTEWDTYYRLSRLATDPNRQQEWQNVDLMEYRTDLSDTEFKELTRLQQQEEGTEIEAEYLRTKNQQVDDALREMGYEPTPDANSEEEAATVRRFRREVQNQYNMFQAQNDRKPTPQEFQDIVDRMMLEGSTRRGGFQVGFGTEDSDSPLFSLRLGGEGSDKRYFQVEEGEQFYIEDVPEAERKKIEQALQRKGREVTNDAIIRLYTRKQLGY